MNVKATTNLADLEDAENISEDIQYILEPFTVVDLISELS